MSCRLWCGPDRELDDCCVDFIAVVATLLFSAIILGGFECAKCIPHKKRPESSKRWESAVLSWIRSSLVLGALLVHLLETAEAVLVLSWLGASRASNGTLGAVLLLATPLSSLLLLLVSAVANSNPSLPHTVRLLLLGSWFSSAIARAARLRHLTSSRQLKVAVHARAISAAFCMGLYCALALIEILIIISQRLRARCDAKSSSTDKDDTAKVSQVPEGYRHARVSSASRATFWWLTPLLWRGARRPLELEDLGRLPSEESTKEIYKTFSSIYQHEQEKGGGTASLWRCYGRNCGPRFLLGGFYKFLGDLVGLAGPLGISVIVEYAARVAQPKKANFIGPVEYFPYLTTSEVLENGYVMGCVVLLASLAQGTFSQASTHLVNVEGIHLKAALQALVYAKSLRLAAWSFGEGSYVEHQKENRRTEMNSNEGHHQDENGSSEHQQQGSGEHGTHVTGTSTHGTDAGSIANLMSEDAYNVMSCVWIGHYVWAIPLKIAVIMWLLYLKLSWSAVIGAALCVAVMTPLQLLIGKRMSSNSKLISEVSDERLRKVNEILQGIKLIKLYSWEDEFSKRISTVREHELKFLNADSLYWALMAFLTHASSALVTLVTLGLYLVIEEGSGLTPQNVFSALALFNQLTVPLFIFPVTVPLIIGAVVSTRRLQEFLALPEISNKHGPPPAPAPEPPVEKQDEGVLQSETSPLRDSSDSVFGPAGLDNIHEDEEEDDEADESKHRPHPLLSSPTPLSAVTVQQESGFAWRQEAETAVLKVSSKLAVPQGQLTLVVGPVGSGKSSLMSALLGEMHVTNGAVSWGTDTTVAYVAQKPWLLNATLRDNILFGHPFRARRYSKVVAACALQPDIAILPAGDLTHIGEKGIAVSGGQRQRICIARALYSRASLLLLDDPLSALDAHVAQHVVEAGVRRLLLRRQHRTVVLITHQLQLLHLADHVVALQDGAVRTQGTLAQIERHDPELVSDWRAAMSRQAAAEEAQRGARSRTARERWQLVRLVSRIGSQLKHKTGINTDGSWMPGEDAHMPRALFVPFRRRLGTSSLSRRHYSHDLPLPIDECADDEYAEIAARSAPPGGDTAAVRLSRAFSGRRNVFRTVSLQTGSSRRRRGSSRHGRGGSLPQLTRQLSSPTMPQKCEPGGVEGASAAVAVDVAPGLVRGRTFTTVEPGGVVRQGSLFKRIFSASSQRSAPAAVQADIGTNLGRERSILRRLISSSSTRSSVSAPGENFERPPVRRLASSTSAFSDDLNEDEEGDEGGDETSCGESSHLAGAEEREYGKVARRVYWSYLKASSPLLGISYLLAALAWQACRVLIDYWLSLWTEVKPHVEQNAQEMRWHLLVYAALSALSIILSLGSNALGQASGARARRVLHEDALRAVLRSPIKFFEATPVGRIMNRFAADMAVIDKKISISIQRLVQFLLLCVSAIVVNIAISPWFALVALPICLVYYWVQRFYRASARELQRLDSLTRSPIFSHFSETLGGLSTIRAFGQQERFTNMLHAKMDSHRNAFLIMNTSNRWLGIALDYLGGVIVFAAVVAALLSARLLPSQVTPALVGLAVNYTLLVPIYLNWVVKFLSDMEMYMTAVERLEHYSRLPSEDYRDTQASTIPAEWPGKGDIRFENISLRYSADREPVVSKLDLIIPTGQKVGICGRTGSGKSSLAMALFCMVEAHEGRLVIDGRDVLHEVPLSTLRSRLSAILQDAIMFSGTLRENLDPRGLFEDSQLWSALELAQMKDIARILPGGLDGEVREGGENLSAGQRQLLCLARAALHDARCLVLDEATSSLDPGTEQRLIAAASRAFEGRTVINIAHRLATLLTCDRILVLSAGRIVEDASPAELLARPSSQFAEMLRASEEGSLV